MANQNFIIGVKTRFFFGLMPSSLLALATPTVPQDVVVTTTSSTNAAATSMAVSALGAAIPKGTPISMAAAATTTTLVTLTALAAIGATSLACSATSADIPSGSTINFNGESVTTTALASSGATTISVLPLVFGIASGAKGFYSGETMVTVYTTADAASGATAISIEAQTGRTTIASGGFGVHRGLVLLEGGTTSNQQMQSTDTETRVYGTKLPYSTGTVTGASWQASYTTNVLPTDIGFFRLKYAAVNALDGVRGWVNKMDPVPTGFTQGDAIQGLCDVTDFQQTNPADGIITATCTFKGRGTPTITHAA
jgi:hypothetical protein